MDLDKILHNKVGKFGLLYYHQQNENKLKGVSDQKKDADYYIYHFLGKAACLYLKISLRIFCSLLDEKGKEDFIKRFNLS